MSRSGDARPTGWSTLYTRHQKGALRAVRLLGKHLTTAQELIREHGNTGNVEKAIVSRAGELAMHLNTCQVLRQVSGAAPGQPVSGARPIPRPQDAPAPAGAPTGRRPGPHRVELDMAAIRAELNRGDTPAEVAARRGVSPALIRQRLREEAACPTRNPVYVSHVESVDRAVAGLAARLESIVELTYGHGDAAEAAAEVVAQAAELSAHLVACRALWGALQLQHPVVGAAVYALRERAALLIESRNGLPGGTIDPDDVEFRLATDDGVSAWIEMYAIVAGRRVADSGFAGADALNRLLAVVEVDGDADA